MWGRREGVRMCECRGEGGGIFMLVCVGGTYFCSCWLEREWKPLILKVSSTSVY